MIHVVDTLCTSTSTRCTRTSSQRFVILPSKSNGGRTNRPSRRYSSVMLMSTFSPYNTAADTTSWFDVFKSNSQFHYSLNSPMI